MQESAVRDWAKSLKCSLTEEGTLKRMNDICHLQADFAEKQSQVFIQDSASGYLETWCRTSLPREDLSERSGQISKSIIASLKDLESLLKVANLYSGPLLCLLTVRLYRASKQTSVLQESCEDMFLVENFILSLTKP